MATEEKTKLTPKQELFCQYYASDREFFGNGTQSYIEAFEPDQSKPNWYNTVRSLASQLLTNTNVFTRINELLELNGLNDVAVDKQLAFVIAQHGDFSSKVAAIKEYNKLKARITDKSEATIVADVTSNGETLADASLAAGFAQYLKDNNTPK